MLYELLDQEIQRALKESDRKTLDYVEEILAGRASHPFFPTELKAIYYLHCLAGTLGFQEGLPESRIDANQDRLVAAGRKLADEARQRRSTLHRTTPVRPAPQPPGPPRLPTIPTLADAQGNVYDRRIDGSWQPKTTIGGIQQRDTTIGGLPAQPPTIGPRVPERTGPGGPTTTGPGGQPLYRRSGPSFRSVN